MKNSRGRVNTTLCIRGSKYSYLACEMNDTKLKAILRRHGFSASKVSRLAKIKREATAKANTHIFSNCMLSNKTR
jgi:hypothetical protein